MNGPMKNITKSRIDMNGNKMALFIQHLSFLGWEIFIILHFGNFINMVTTLYYSFRSLYLWIILLKIKNKRELHLEVLFCLYYLLIFFLNLVYNKIIKKKVGGIKWIFTVKTDLYIVKEVIKKTILTKTLKCWR